MNKKILSSFIILIAAGTCFGQVLYSFPDQVKSSRFEVNVNGLKADAALAALNFHFVNFDFKDSVEVKVIAKDAGYWDAGVEIRPFSKGFFPKKINDTITFTIKEPCKLSLERKGRTDWNDEVLFIFANEMQANIPDKADENVIWISPGYHKTNIDLKDNQTLYLEGGAVIDGSVNVWNAQNVKILGRGWIIHDGPQDTKKDVASQQKKNWHPINTNTVTNLEIDGIVLSSRSRTWTIQSTETYKMLMNNVKIITGFIRLNGDGFDAYGGGDIVVKNCFIRGTDDIFAFYQQWWGEKKRYPEIKNFNVSDCVFWPSQANIIRIGWQGNQPDTRNFTMTNCDIIHMEENGKFHVPYSLLCIWGSTDSVNKKTVHHSFHFNNIRFDHGVAVAGIELIGEESTIGEIRFSNIQFLDEPDLRSVITANIDRLVISNYRNKGYAITDLKNIFEKMEGVKEMKFVENTTPLAVMTRAINGSSVLLSAASSIPYNNKKIVSYKWNLGDGTIRFGREVEHVYSLSDPDRVVSLEIIDEDGKKDFVYARYKAIKKHN